MDDSISSVVIVIISFRQKKTYRIETFIFKNENKGVVFGGSFIGRFEWNYQIFNLDTVCHPLMVCLIPQKMRQLAVQTRLVIILILIGMYYSLPRREGGNMGIKLCQHPKIINYNFHSFDWKIGVLINYRLVGLNYATNCSNLQKG